jgi:hypothetical protein
MASTPATDQREGNEGNKGFSETGVAHPGYNRSPITNHNFFSVGWAEVAEQDAALA